MKYEKQIKAPWLKYYSEENRFLDYPEFSIYEAVQKAAETHANVHAYEFQGKATTYNEFLKAIDETARGLVAAGISKGDTVTIMMPNTPQGVNALYAINRVNAVAATIHPLSAPGEIKYYLNMTNSKAIIVLDMFYEKAMEAISELDFNVKVIVARIQDALKFPLNVLYPVTVKKKPAPLPKNNSMIISWNSFIKNGKGVQLPKIEVEGNDTAIVLFSGGTTGTSKGIELTNINMNALVWQLRSAAGFSLENMRMLSVMPLFHGFGLGVGIHTPLAVGGTCILVPQFTVKTYAKLIKKEKPTVIPGVPTLFEALLRTTGLDGVDLSFLDGVFCGGDSLPVELKKKVDKFLFEHNAKITIREGFGTTECVTASCLTPFEKENYRVGSIGIPFPDTYYQIVDPTTDEEIPYGQEGEICISGPSVMKRYLKNVRETASTLRTHSDGNVWLHTGDLGTMDSDGFVYFKQRLKRLIIVSGINVYPSQVENAICSHSDVLLACCIGIPDPYKMQVVKAFVVLKPGVEPSDKIKEEILAICNKNVSIYGRPREIEFRTELPKTLVGKVAYRKLEEEELTKRKEK